MVRRIMLVCACVLAITSPCVAQYYAVRALDRLPGTTGDWAMDINDSGLIVGSASTPDGTRYPVIWNASGTVSRIGTVSAAAGNAVNNSGVVAGTAGPPGGSHNGFLWSPPGVIVDLPMTAAYGINNRGQVCGFTGNKAKIWNPDGTVTDIIVPNCQWAYARSINDAGQIAGYGGSSTGHDHPFTWCPSKELTMLPTVAFGDSAAHCVNNRGQIAGYVTVSRPGWNGRVAVIWEADGTLRLLSHSDQQYISGGNAINDADYVVGHAPGDQSYPAPALWTPDNTQILLPMLPGCETGEAMSINSQNQIVGYCTSRTTWESYPVMWELVPEPSCLAALAGGLVGLGCLVMRRRR